MNSISIDELTIGHLLSHPPYPLPYTTLFEYNGYLLQLQEREELLVLARDNSINVLREKYRGQGNVVFYIPFLSIISQVEENLKDLHLGIRRCHSFTKKIREILKENAIYILEHSQ